MHSARQRERLIDSSERRLQLCLFTRIAAPGIEELKRTLTREELHDLVWSTPILRLAEEFGLSDRGFAKICARHLVPTPPRGYWAKVEAGQPVKKTPLRSVENKALHKVRIGSSQTHLSQGVQAALAAAKAVKRRLAQERRKDQAEPNGNAPGVELPGDSPHRSVATLVRRIRKAKPNSDGLISAPGVAVHERSRERAATILHNLALAAEAKEAQLSVSGDRLFFSTTVGSLLIALTEERRRPKHVPTEEELAKYERLRAKRKRDQERWIWSFGRLEPWPEFDIIYTGKLTIGYDGWIRGLRKSWSDGRTQTVEGSLSDFVAGMQMIISAEAEDARIRRDKERARQMLLHRRQLAEQRTNREGKRFAYLKWVAETRREINDFRMTIDAVPRTADLPDEYKRMLRWAEDRLAELEAKTTVEQIRNSLIEQNLFPEPDDLLDPEGDPPTQQNNWDD